MNKRDFIRAVSKEANFTMGDVAIILEAMIRVLEKVIESKTPFKVRGFGQLIYATLPKRKVSKKISPEGKMFPPALRLTFKLGDNLRSKVK